MTRFDVAKTALFVAAVRARETERVDPLFKDQLSSLLAGPEGMAWLAASETDPKSNYRRGSFPYVEVRTRYFDDWTQEAVRESGALQLVLLGAGMDTRAFRLPWPPGFRFFETDTPELFALKEARLQSAGVRLDCERVVVQADLTSNSWVRSLLRQRFDKNRPAVWLAEGLFLYLTATDVKQILEGAASISSQGSRLGAEILSMEFLHKGANKWTLQRRKDRGTPWVFGTDNPEELLQSHGWTVDTEVGVVEAAKALGRWRDPRASPSRGSQDRTSGASFVTATKAPSGKASKRSAR